MSYVYVDVADHKIGPGKAKFGKNAANLWKKHMQWAEGPKAFEEGYKYLTQVYAKDWRRLAYLLELYQHPERHHFAAVHTYVCGRGVDMSYIATRRCSKAYQCTCCTFQIYECSFGRRYRMLVLRGEEMGIWIGVS